MAGTDDVQPSRLLTLPTWLIGQTGVHAHQLLTEALSTADARGYHYRLLAALEEFGPASQATLGRRTDMDRSDVAEALNELAGQGLVKRSGDPVDRRRNVITITRAGATRLLALDEVLAEVQDELLAPLSATQRQTLVRMLTRVLEHHDGILREDSGAVMRFAISIPQYARDSHFDDVAFRAHLRRVEELGLFESAWAQEQVIGAAGSIAPLQTLTFAAACTEQLRLGCAVFVLPLHNPLHLAKAISSLDCLSHGRVEVGIATGGRGRPFEAFGIDPDKPVARFNEALALMKACWTQREINFDGRLWKLHGASMEPKPVQKPYPPVWFGGSVPAGMRRAVRHGDGFMGAGSQTPAQFAEQVKVVREELSAQGRDPGTFRIGKRVYVHVDDDAAHGRRRLEDALTEHYGRGGWSEHIFAGPPETCAAGIRAVADAGAELILLNPLVDDAEQLERLAGEVIPALS